MLESVFRCCNTDYLGRLRVQENLDWGGWSRLGNSERAALDAEAAHGGIL